MYETHETVEDPGGGPTPETQPGAGVAERGDGPSPLAMVQGEPVTDLPRDLYIPPHALEVFLDTFEGPLDLLLYLIKRQNLDILDIPIAEITRQYVEYVEMMKDMQLELAAEYLVMAAMLAEIKSRMLLPRPVEEGQEDDPRAELVRRLQEYERFKKAAEELDGMPRMGRDVFPVSARPPESRRPVPMPRVELQDILMAFKQVLDRAEVFSQHHIQRERLSVRERMSLVVQRVSEGGFVAFSDLFDPAEGRQGVVVTLLAVLELAKEQLVEFVQSGPFAPIHLKSIEARAGEDAAAVEDAVG